MNIRLFKNEEHMAFLGPGSDSLYEQKGIQKRFGLPLYESFSQEAQEAPKHIGDCHCS